MPFNCGKKYMPASMEKEAVAFLLPLLGVIGLGLGAGGAWLGYDYYQQARNLAQSAQEFVTRDLPAFKRMVYGGLGGAGLGALLGYALAKPEQRTAAALLGGLGGLTMGGLLGPSLLQNVNV